MTSLRTALSRLLTRAAALCGSRIVDCHTGAPLGRGFLVPWRGVLRLVGYSGTYCRPVFLPQSRLTYWKQEIGFAAHPAPDFPRLAPAPNADRPARILWALVTHQGPEETARMVAHWKGIAPTSDIVILHGGSPGAFATLTHPHKAFVDDPGLRTRHHQREKQSFDGVLRATAAWLAEHPEFTHVYCAEYDHIPAAPDLGARLLERLARENADVLAHHLQRVDGTGHPHFLQHQADPLFPALWERISLRNDHGTVLSMLGSGSFWTRQAWLETAAVEPGTRIYLELFPPTAAHHLGFRVRDFQEQNDCVRALPDPALSIEATRGAERWTVHPLKGFWS